MTPPQGLSPMLGIANTDLPIIHLLVVDFDDTLYDWIGHFVPALDAMMNAAAQILKIPVPTIQDELRAVHRYYGNTEQPFALLETASARALIGHLTRAEQREAMAPAFAAFDQVRAARLTPFDDVFPTLGALRDTGITIIGYSAATTVNIAKRIRLLGLAPLFDVIYASPHSGLPYPGALRSDRDALNVIELASTKPDPNIIPMIAAEHKVPPERMLFVGDSIASDIAPAVHGGAHAALVRRDADPLTTWLPDLLRVSHRKAESRADSLTLSDADLARVPVIRSLSELWKYFVFTRQT